MKLVDIELLKSTSGNCLVDLGDCKVTLSEILDAVPKITSVQSSMSIHINLNDVIKVKLTDYGKEIWLHQYDDINLPDSCSTPALDVDDQGYTSMQLWCFMNLFGNHMHMGVNNVIEPLELIVEGDLYVEVI